MNEIDDYTHPHLGVVNEYETWGIIHQKDFLASRCKVHGLTYYEHIRQIAGLDGSIPYEATIFWNLLRDRVTETRVSHKHKLRRSIPGPATKICWE